MGRGGGGVCVCVVGRGAAGVGGSSPPNPPAAGRWRCDENRRSPGDAQPFTGRDGA